jgi:pimeloyl-ACP methyl ester carboxylesterase
LEQQKMKIKTLEGSFSSSLPTLVCLHSSASSRLQWQKLAENSGDHFNVIAHSLLGYADAPCSTPQTTMDDQTDHLHQVLRKIPGPIHLVGHSFGGAVAMRFVTKSAFPLSSLTLYESVNFDLLFGPNAPDQLADEVCRLGNLVIYHVKRGQLEAAAELFMDYWNGKGAWAGMPVLAQNRLLMRMPTVAWEFQAAFAEIPDQIVYTRQCLPVQILYGTRSPQPARWMAKKLGELMPRSEIRELSGLDHLGPITRPDIVNPLILKFADSSRDVQRRAQRAA